MLSYLKDPSDMRCDEYQFEPHIYIRMFLRGTVLRSYIQIGKYTMIRKDASWLSGKCPPYASSRLRGCSCMISYNYSKIDQRVVPFGSRSMFLHFRYRFS